MDYLKEIRNKINEFCNEAPANGFEINYLENARELLDLYGEALELLENETDNSELKKVYEKVNNLVQK